MFTDGEVVEAKIQYAQLWEEVRGLAGYLQTRVKRGDRVLLFYPPGLDFVVGVFACHAAGLLPSLRFHHDATGKFHAFDRSPKMLALR